MEDDFELEPEADPDVRGAIIAGSTRLQEIEHAIAAARVDVPPHPSRLAGPENAPDQPDMETDWPTTTTAVH